MRYDEASKQLKYSNGDVYDPNKDWAPWAPNEPGSRDRWAGDCVGVIQDYATGNYKWAMADCRNAFSTICIVYNVTAFSK